MAGPGVFDSLGGTYDTQTSKAFFRRLFLEARKHTIVGKLSRSGREDVASMYSGREGSIDGTAAITRKQIDSGDMLRFTMQEHATGTPTYGDLAVQRGDYLGYRTLDARVNMIKSPAIPVQGEMAQQRVKESITNIEGSVRQEVIEYMAEEMEFEFIRACLYGASSSCLLATSSGGLGMALGIDGSAGVPLMPMHFFCNDQGWATYSTTSATYNGNINTYAGSISATADEITLVACKKIRDGLDSRKFRPITYNGKKYKALALCDPLVWYRLAHLLNSSYLYAAPRGMDNPVFNADFGLDYLGMHFLPVENLRLFRAAAGSSYPTIGPGLSTDPRTYTPTATIGWVILLGAGAVVEGYNGSIRVTREVGYHEDGVEVAARTKLGYVRSEWFAKDGRTDSTSYYCDSIAAAAFYEPGIGTDYS